MSEIKNTFGVINSDTDPQLIENGDYQYALNIRNSGSTGEQIGTIEPVRGNEHKVFNLPSGINTCIGQFSHDEENTIYFFIHNNGQQHQIIRYRYELEVFQVVLRTPELKFNLLNHIVEVNIIGDQLFFNDALNEVRRVDITEALSFSDGEVWEFEATFLADGTVELSGTTPPPFEIDDTITVIRDWRNAWLDYDGTISQTGTILIQEITAPGSLDALSVYVGTFPIGFQMGSIDYNIGGEIALAQAIVDSINNSFTNPNFGASIVPGNPTEINVFATSEFEDSFEGASLILNDTGGLEYAGSTISITGTTPQYGYFHDYDPNPQISGEHQITNIVGNSVFFNVGGTMNQDFVTDGDNESYIGGRAYLFVENRNFNLPFEESFIKLYREPPGYTVHCEYGSDQSKLTNNIRGHLYQFKTRYVYANGMRSVPSAISKIANPRYEKNIPFQDLPVWQDNYISTWFDTGGDDVVAIDLLVREVGGEDNDFFLVDTIRKDQDSAISNTSYNYRYYGDEVIIKLPVPEGVQPMDYIPWVGHAFCFIRDKRDAIGGCEEGFDHTDVDVGFSRIRTASGPEVPFLVALINQELGGPSDSDSTEGGLPAELTTQFPLNRIAGPSRYLVGLQSLAWWGAFRSPLSTDEVSVYSFSYGSNSTQPFNTGWTGLAPAPSVFNPDAYEDGSGWQIVSFSIEDEFGVPFGNPAPGATVTMVVEFRASRHLVWHKRTPILTPDDTLINDHFDGTPGNFDQYEGVLSFARHGQDPNSSYYYFFGEFSMILSATDDAESVRDYFVEQLQNATSLQGSPEIILATYTNLEGGDGWRSKHINANIGIDVQPVGVTGIRFRPTVDIPALGVADDGGSVNAGTVSLQGLKSWYEVVGINNLKTTVLINNNAGRRGFKTGANHLLGVEYSANGRRATISPVDIQYVRYFNEVGGLDPYGIGLIARIFNTAPIWATHWQLMYAGNASMFNWITFEVYWILQDDGDDTIQIALSRRIIDYNKQMNDGGASDIEGLQGRSNLAYSWSRGDRLRFLSLWGGDQEEADTGVNDIPAPNFIDVEIIGEATSTNENPAEFAPFGTVLLVDKSDVLPYLNDNEIGRGSLVEVYTPKNVAESDETLYYEIGEKYKVTDGSHHGNRFNQFINTPGADKPFAEVLLKNQGDAWVLGRRNVNSAIATRSKDRIVEAQSASDFYPSEGWGPGTANRVNFDAKRELKKELIRYSDFLLGDSNGLNRYFDGNVSDEPDVIHGLIQRMECPDTNLYLFQELSTGLMPVRALQLTSATGESQIMRSDNVIGNIQYIPGNFGIGVHRESLSYWGGVFYFASIANGLILRLAGTQFEAISKKKKDNYWNTVFEQISRARPKVRILTEFDPKYGELIVYVPAFYIGLPAVGARPDFEGATWGYSELKKGWTTQYSYFPDVLGRHRNKFVSWKRGQLYIHDKTENWNEYYQNEPAEESKIKLVFNQRPQAMKFLQGIGLMMNENPIEPKEVVITTPYKGGQRTSLFSGDFEYQEDQFFAAVWQNELTPGVEDPIINGDDMRGQYFIVELTFGPENKFELFAVSLEHKDSEHTIKPTR